MRIAIDRALLGELEPVPSSVLARFEGRKSDTMLGCPLVDARGIPVAGYEPGYEPGQGASLRSPWYSLRANELDHPEKAKNDEDRRSRERRRALAVRLTSVPFSTDTDGTAWFVIPKGTLDSVRKALSA